MKRLSGFALAIFGLMLFVAAPSARAQILYHVHARINFPFVVGNKVMPAGTYNFRMVQGSDLRAMYLTNSKDTRSATVLVRTSVDHHTPQKSQLKFKRYGNMEFLSRVYETGEKDGVAVINSKREEARMLERADLHKPVQHTTVQAQQGS